jgi:hypothetical protein
MAKTRTVVLCLLSLGIAVSFGYLLRAPGTKPSPEWRVQRTEISRITMIKPHDQMRQLGESGLIQRQASTSNMSPTEFAEFLVEIDNIKLGHIGDGLKSLTLFHDFSVAHLRGRSNKENTEFMQAQWSQSSEMAAIQSQVLQREIAALKAWKPGSSAEQCLAIADSQLQK